MVPTSAPFGCNAAYEKSGRPAAAAGRMMMMINPITGDSLTPRGTASPSSTGACRPACRGFASLVLEVSASFSPGLSQTTITLTSPATAGYFTLW